jgi:hypothetical protein
MIILRAPEQPVQQKRFTSSVFLILLLQSALGGCSGISTPGPDGIEKKRLAGVSLRVACPDKQTGAIVAEISRGWAERVGLRELKTTYYDPDRDERPDEGADLWVLSAAQLPRWATERSLEPLPDDLTAADAELGWSRLLPQYREHLLKWHGLPYAVPLLGDAPLCFYRKDLLADSGHREAFGRQHPALTLKPPETWDEFAAIADYFSQSREPGQTRPSLPPLPRSDRELDRLFWTLAASIARRAVAADSDAAADVTDEDLFAFQFDPETGRPRIAGPGFVRALQLLQRLHPCRPSQSTAEPWASFRDGQAVLCLGDARLLGEFQAPGSKVRDRVGVCLVPGNRGYISWQTAQVRPVPQGINRVPYLGGGAFVLAVPRTASAKDAAFELLTELGGRALSNQVVLDPRWGGGATRAGQLDFHWDAWRLERSDAEALRTVIRQTLQHGLRNPVLCLRVPNEHRFRNALTREIRPALQAGKAGSEEEALLVLRRVERTWEDVIGTSTEEHKRLYRSSLGLLGSGK